VASARLAEPACGGQDRLVGGVLDAELEDVDASTKRAVQEGVGAIVADQIQVGVPQSLESVVHASSLAGAWR
jgi:hypothetical protein